MYLTYDYPSQLKTTVITAIKRTFKAVTKFFASIGNALVVAQQKRVDYWRLNNMTDKQLKDIGITRGEIKQRFYGTDSQT
jgi:uncharacterized protein YjiS (DUF1127 family)